MTGGIFPRVQSWSPADRCVSGVRVSSLAAGESMRAVILMLIVVCGAGCQVSTHRARYRTWVNWRSFRQPAIWWERTALHKTQDRRGSGHWHWDQRLFTDPRSLAAGSAPSSSPALFPAPGSSTTKPASAPTSVGPVPENPFPSEAGLPNLAPPNNTRPSEADSGQPDPPEAPDTEQPPSNNGQPEGGPVATRR